MEFPLNSMAFGRWDALALRRIRSRKGALRFDKSFIERLVNLSWYVNFG